MRGRASWRLRFARWFGRLLMASSRGFQAGYRGRKVEVDRGEWMSSDVAPFAVRSDEGAPAWGVVMVWWSSLVVGRVVMG